MRIRNAVLSIILALAVLGALALLGYVTLNHGSTENFTEFYILGSGDRASGYPTQMVLGLEESVIVGIVNREHETLSYQVVITIDNTINSKLGPVTLGHDEKWEGIVDIMPEKVGDDQKVEFLLYKQNEGKVYQTLHLWVNVIEAEYFQQ